MIKGKIKRVVSIYPPLEKIVRKIYFKLWLFLVKLNCHKGSEREKFRCELLEFVKLHKGKTYQTLPHSILENIPAIYGDRRTDLIVENIFVKGGTVLDIGANLGHFCHVLEEKGFDCYAVENNPRHLYFLRKLKEMENKKFQIIPESIFNYKRGSELSFDVVLALNIFHHFLRTKETYDELIVLLKRIKAREMFFQTDKDVQTKLVRLISEHTGLKYQYIGETNGRKIYKLYVEIGHDS